MKTAITTSFKVLLAALAGIALYVPVAEAGGRGNDGAGSVEFSVPISYMGSTTINGQNGSSADVNSVLSTGFGIGYNINDNFQVNSQFSWANRNYSATIPGGGIAGGGNTYKGTLNTASIQLNAVYYLLPGNFTPFVSGGFGTTFVDSNIPDGNAVGTCYWDPYWGQVCGLYQPTKSASNVSYNYALGARMDLSKAFSLQGSFSRMYIDAPGSRPSFDSFKMEFIFRM